MMRMRHVYFKPESCGMPYMNDKRYTTLSFRAGRWRKKGVRGNVSIETTRQ